jgi:transposase-like protein
MTEILTAIACKNCGSTDVVKFGTYKGNQRYLCHACKRKFKADNTLFGGKVSAGDISSALLEYYSGSSVNDIRRRIQQEKGYKPAQSTVFQWIDKFTNKAVKYYDQFQPKVGDTWIGDETVIHLDAGVDIWLWDVIDEETRFILASKISYRRNTEDAITLFELAKRRAGKSPKVLLTDGLNLYPEAVRSVFGSDVHVKSNPFVKNGEGDATRPIERWHETLKERTKVIYALRDTNSALAFLDGFIAYYNFIRPHEGLDEKTPAEAAGIDYPVKTWADVTHLGEKEPEKTKPEYKIPAKLEEARHNLTGQPSHMGRPYGSHKGVNKAAIMAEQKRQLKDRLHTEQAALEAKRKYEAEAQVLALASFKKETTMPMLDTPIPYKVKKMLYGEMPKELR